MTPAEAAQLCDDARLPGLVDHIDRIAEIGRDYAEALEREANVPTLKRARHRLARLRRASADLRGALRDMDPVTAALLPAGDAALLPWAFRAAVEVGTATAWAQGEVEAKIAPQRCRGGPSRVLPRHALRNLVGSCADLLSRTGQAPTSTGGGPLHRLVAGIHVTVTGDLAERGIASIIRQVVSNRSLQQR